MMRRAIAIALLVLVASAAPATAAGQQTPPPVPPDPLDFASLQTVPDVVGYISIVIPNPVAALVCETEPTGGSWFDVSYQVAHLAWLVKNLFVELVCALVQLLQALANGLTRGINTALAGVNVAVRLAVWQLLQLRSAILSAWYLVEVLRDALQQIQEWLFLLQLYAGAFLLLAGQLLAIAGQTLGQLVAIAGELAGILSWLGGLVLGLATSILTALQGSSVPEQLEGTSPIYRIVHGIGAGIRDSSIGWALVVVWGMCYVAFVTWIGRFLGAGGE